MKISEAEKLVCPFRSAGMYNLGANIGMNCDTNCITSGCMAWQHTEYEKGHKTKDDGIMVRKLIKVAHQTGNGYCQRLKND